MRIPIHDTHPATHGKPGGILDIEVETPHPRLLSIRFRDVSAPHWSKQDDMHGMELVWLISEAPPRETEDLVHSAFAARNPLELSFKESERGMRVRFAVRWENGTVRKGEWSEIFSAVIP